MTSDALRKVLLCALGYLLLSGAGVGPEADGGTMRVVTLTSHDSAPYKKTEQGFREYLESRPFRVEWEAIHLHGDKTQARRTIRELEANPPDLVFVLGALAADLALDAELAAPVVACLVLNRDVFADAENSTGVVLEFPLETQLEWIRQILPDSRRVGVLYSSQGDSEAIGRATEIARDLGLRLVAHEVREPKDLPLALETLARHADLIWTLPDPGVVTSETTRPLLLFSFRNRIPFVGLSAAWVKAGALYSLERDYGDLGAQCGELAEQVLGGVAVESLPVARPRKVVLALNSRTAEHMRLRIPDRVVRDANLVMN